jgi:hypothetical protein
MCRSSLFSARAIVILGLLLTIPLTTCAGTNTPEQWREDLRFVVEQLRKVHPEPYLRTTQAEFDQRAANLEDALPTMDEVQVVARMMELVASIGDGHTSLLPSGHSQFQSRFPLRVQRFYDGLYIVCIRRDLGHLAGARIVKVGDLAAEDAFDRVAKVASGDSEIGRRITGSMLFSTAGLLLAQGVIQSPKNLPLTVVSQDGKTEHVRLEVVTPDDAPLTWSRRLFQPPNSTDCVHPFSAGTGDLPLHLRGLLPQVRVMWFEHLRARRSLYVQLNTIQNTRQESFAAFTARLWDYYDSNAADVDRLIIDLRHNPGGNGFLLLPFVHELIKHEAQLGRLYVLIGNSTFSAAGNLLAQLIEHTNAIVVGEPTSGPLNWCSDTNRFTLPHSAMTLTVSTLCWQKGHPADTRGHAPPDFPILTSGADFLAGRDPVLDAVLSDQVRPLADVLRDN